MKYAPPAQGLLTAAQDGNLQVRFAQAAAHRLLKPDLSGA